MNSEQAFGDLFTPATWRHPALVAYVTLLVLGYMIYLFSDRTGLLRALARRLGDRSETGEEGIQDSGREWLVYLHKLAGFLLLGPLGLLLARLRGDFTGYLLPRLDLFSPWLMPPLVLVTLVSLLRRPGGIDTGFYPQVRKALWDRRRIALNTLFWTLYLLGYEYAFRGWLLFPLAAELGAASAVAINASLYALAHIYKGPGEAFGAFFLGILFCIIALAGSSFFIPFVMHVIMAVGNDMAALKAHPSMRLQGRA